MATLFSVKHPKQAHCRTCGKKLKKSVQYIEFGPDRHRGFYIEGDDPDAFPKTREEAQRQTNQQIVHFKWGGPKNDRRIVRISIWDGETYQGGYFCTTQCAVDFAFLLAELGHQTVKHRDSTAYQRVGKETDQEE